MATKLEILNLYRFFQKNRFQAVEDVRGRSTSNKENYEKSGDFYTDPEKFFNTALGITQDDTDKFKTIELPTGLDFLNTSNEEERGVELGKQSDLDKVAKDLKEYIIKHQKYSHFVNKLKETDLNISDSEKARLQGIYKENASATEISNLTDNDFDDHEKELQKEVENRDKIEALYKSFPNVVRTDIESYFVGGELVKTPKKSVFEDVVDGNGNVVNDKNGNPKKQIKKDGTGNPIAETTESTSTDILTHLQTVAGSNKKTIKAVSDKFEVPVNYSQTKETNPENYKRISDGMNNSSWMKASASMNDKITGIYKDSSRHPSWGLKNKKGETVVPKEFKYKNPKLFQTLMPGENLDFLFEPLDFVLGLGTNLIRRGAHFVSGKDFKNKKNDAQALYYFCQNNKKMKASFDALFSDDQKAKMAKNPGSIWHTGFKMNRLFRDKIRKEFGSIEEINNLYIQLQKDTKDKNPEEREKAFKDLDYIAEMYLRKGRTPYLLQGLFHKGRRFFGNKQSRIQRRIRQSARSGGNYLTHSQEAIKSMEDLFAYFESTGMDLREIKGFRRINKRLNKLKAAKANNKSGTFYDLEDSLLNAIQKANLIGGRRSKTIEKMHMIIKDEKDQGQKETLLRKMNFIVSNVSTPRKEWYSLRRLSPGIETLFMRKNKARFERGLNASLHGLNISDKKSYNKDLMSFLETGINQPAFTGGFLKRMIAKLSPFVNINKGKYEIPKSLTDIALNGGKLGYFDRIKLKKYLSKIDTQASLKGIVNTSLKSEQNLKTGRKNLSLDNDKIGKVGLLKSMIDKNNNDIGETIDASDKVIVEKFANKSVNGLSKKAYEALLQEATSKNINSSNLPIYVSLKNIEHSLDEISEKFSKGTEEQQKSAEKAGKFLSDLKQLAEELEKSGSDFVYSNDPKGNFTTPYEELIKKTEGLRREVSEGTAGTVSFQKTMEEKYGADDKVAENLDKEVENIENEMNEAIKQGQEKIMSEFATAVDKKIEEDKNNNKNNLPASKALLDKLQKKEKELDDLLKSTMQAPTADVEKAKKQIQELKDKVEGKEAEKTKKKKEKPIEDLNLKILELQASKKTTQEKEDAIQVLNNKAMNILKTYQKAGEKTPDEVTELFTKILQIETKINQEKILEKLAQKDEFGNDNDGSVG